jgi:F-type H+-transporting ATPase subunit alpha
VSIWTGTKGKLDEVPIEDILRFERELIDYVGRNTSILTELRDTNVLSDDIADALDKAVDAFKLEFQTGEGKALDSVGHEEFAEVAPEEISQEQIVRQKR